VHVDEPIVNKHMQTIDELDQAIAQQCRILSHDKPRIKSQTYFSWWPQKQTAN
jgi:hypothetical protein